MGKFSSLTPEDISFCQVLTLCSAFCVVMGIYQSFEYAFCYEDEKKDQYKLISLIKRARRMAEEESHNEGDNAETARLLGAEAIPLHNMSSPSREGDLERTRLLGGERNPRHNLSSLSREILSAQSADVASLDNAASIQGHLESISTNNDREDDLSVSSKTNQTAPAVGGARPKSTRVSPKSGCKKSSTASPGVHGSDMSDCPLPPVAGSQGESSSSSSDFGDLVSGWDYNSTGADQSHSGSRADQPHAAKPNTRSKSTYAKLSGNKR